MAQTTTTTTMQQQVPDLSEDHLSRQHASRFRTLLTIEEYERQGLAFTKQQLKNASLYTQHTFHFFVLSMTARLALLWTRKTLYAALVGSLLVAFVLFGVYTGTNPRHTEGGTLVPALTFSQRLARLSESVLDKIRQFTGQAKKGLLLPEDVNGFGHCTGAQNASGSAVGNEGYEGECHLDRQAQQRAQNVEDRTANQRTQTPAHAAGETALVDASDAGFATFIQSQTAKGMNIFAFAFSVAKQLAVSIFETFGWSNGTATATAAAPTLVA